MANEDVTETMSLGDQVNAARGRWALLSDEEYFALVGQCLEVAYQALAPLDFVRARAVILAAPNVAAAGKGLACELLEESSMLVDVAKAFFEGVAALDAAKAETEAPL